jgi:hypothetical protein
MRCDCCDAELSEAEATAKFEDSGAYVDMCGDCRSYLPSDIKVRTRRLPQKQREVNHDVDKSSPFLFNDGEEWDDS